MKKIYWLMVSVFALLLFVAGCGYKVSAFKPDKLIQKINGEELNQSDFSQKYAVLISGWTEARHKKNLFIAYQVLLENGFTAENIYILDNKGDEARYYAVTDLASKESIALLFNHLKEKIKPSDLLFVYATDHGGTKIKNSVEMATIMLPIGEDMDEAEFINLAKDIQSERKIFIFTQCHGGNFVVRVGNEMKNIIAVALNLPDKEKTFSYDFSQAFFGAFRERRADVNDDGRVSIKESFDYAFINDIETQNGLQTPFLISDINPENIFLK